MKFQNMLRACPRLVVDMAAPVLVVAGSLAVGAIVAARPAHALVVYDPTNYTQNVLTAARSLEQITHQITMLENQALSLANQAKNLTTFTFPELDALKQTLQKIESLMNQAAKIEFKASGVDSQYTSLYPGTYNSSLTMTQQQSAAKSRLDAQVAAYKQTMTVQAQIVENVASDRDNLSTLATRSQSSEGALQAAQVTNQLLALIAKQQLQLQQLLSAQFRAQALGDASGAETTAVSQGTTTKFLGSGSAYTRQ